MGWTHSICKRCWIYKNPERVPVTLNIDKIERCCFCGDTHTSGIFIREEPKILLCDGCDD